jgi:cytochrome b561
VTAVQPSTDPARTTASRGMAATAHVVLAGAIPVLVLVQATLAGQHLFQGDSITLHGILGNITFTLTVVGVVLAVARRCSALVFGLAVALVALTFAQVGLGYVGRETLAAASWHIPVGVAIFGLSTYQMAVLTRRS